MRLARTAKLCAQLRARRMPILSFKRASVALLATLSVFAFQSTAQADFTSITGTRAVTLATDGDCTPNNFTRFNIDVQLDSTGGDRIYLIDGNNLIIDTVNIGSGPLDISGLGIVTSNTPGAAPFAIVFSNAQTYTAGATYVADGDEVERTTFDPSLLDSDCPSPAPEIEISGNGQVILDRTSAAQLADHSQFENTDVGSTSTRTYTIRNLGSANLTVGASLQSGVVFSITGAPTSPVAPGSSTTVTVQFAPAFEVTTGDTLIITSNDGSEAETRFPIAGTGTNGTPNFEVREELGSIALTIAHNDMAPRVADGTDFGGVDVTAGTESNTFNVQPAGSSAPALFTGAPSRVQITGTHAGDFSVTQDLPASQSGGAVLFTIQFDPSGPGLRQATVEIPSNVTGKNPYTFAIQGTGTGVTTGDVTFEVSIDGGDATLNLASPTPALAVAITTANGQATRNIANVASGTHIVTLPDLTVLGFGWTSISCADGDSTVDLAALTMTLELGVGEDLTCTLELIETRTATSRMIADFLGARNSQILANQPGFSRRWQRLNGGGDAPSSLTASVLGFSHTFAFPFQVAVSENALSYAATLSGLTGNAAARSGDVGSWDVWSEGQVARFDDAVSDDGLFAILHAGVDYRASEKVLLGLAASIDWTEQANTANSGDVSGTGWMLGPYATVRIDEQLFVDLRAAWGQSSNSINPFGTYTDSFDTTRWLVAGSVGGDYAYGSWTLNPIVSVQYLSERQDAYVDSLSVAIPSQTVAQGDVRFEPRLSYLHKFDDGTRLRPWVRVSGVYTFGDGGNASVGSLARAFEGLTASVQTGLEMHAAGGASLALSGQMDGFGANDAQSYGASVSVSVPLN